MLVRAYCHFCPTHLRVIKKTALRTRGSSIILNYRLPTALGIFWQNFLVKEFWGGKVNPKEPLNELVQRKPGNQLITLIKKGGIPTLFKCGELTARVEKVTFLLEAKIGALCANSSPMQS